MTIDKQKLRELAQWKIDVHGEPETLLTGERADASLQWSRAANPQAVLSLLDENEALLAERDALAAEVERLRADYRVHTEALAAVAGQRQEYGDSARAECERLRKLVVEACQAGEDAVEELDANSPESHRIALRIAAIRKEAES